MACLMPRVRKRVFRKLSTFFPRTMQVLSEVVQVLRLPWLKLQGVHPEPHWRRIL